MNRFDRALRGGGVLIADGAMGTQIEERRRADGSTSPISPEAALLESTETIRSIHADYVRAGADAILTCTFGASRLRLRKLGLESRFETIHRTAAEVAREVAGPDGVVLGSLGPLGELLSPSGRLSRSEAASLYGERAVVLAETGQVDAILVETQYDLGEVEAAVEAVRASCALPVIVTMSFDTRGRTMMGVSPEAMAAALVAEGVEVMGANCGRSMEETFEAVCRIRAAAPDAWVWAKPNAGLPRVIGDRAVYDLTPAAFASWAKRFVAEGVRVFGGCCGTTPEHIAAAARAVRGQRPPRGPKGRLAG
jgi:methionine synthase I (cobalamin-dependent)